MELRRKVNMRVRFVIRKSRLNSLGNCPLDCRVRIDGKPANTFSTRLSISPEKWDSKMQRIKGATEVILNQNRTIEALKYELEQIFTIQRARGKYLTAQELVDVYTGKLDLESPISAVTKMYIEELQVKDRAKATITRYKRNYEYLQEYLKTDFPVQLVERKHVSGFWMWLKRKGLHHDYCNKIVQACVGLFRFAIRNGYIETSPFAGLALEWKKELDITCLSASEAELIYATQWCPKLQRVVDSFMFMCYTGLHISDYIALAESSRYMVGNIEWMKIRRVKTHVQAMFPLHERAKTIIDKYGGIEKLPRITGQKQNEYLKLVALQVGIEKNLTNKIARKTFTNMAINDWHMSLESVAAMLGHTSTRQIKHYGAVNENRIYAEWTNKQ